MIELNSRLKSQGIEKSGHQHVAMKESQDNKLMGLLCIIQRLVERLKKQKCVIARPDPISHVNYENFVREGVGLSPIWGALKRQVFLGDETFVDKAITRIEGIVGEGDLREVPIMQRRVQAKSLDWYMGNYSSRDEGIVSAYVSGDYLMKDIADGFNVHYSTVSRAIKKAEMRDCKT